jgi:hypothetical protein
MSPHDVSRRKFLGVSASGLALAGAAKAAGAASKTDGKADKKKGGGDAPFRCSGTAPC